MTVRFAPNKKLTVKGRELVMIEDVVGSRFPSNEDIIPVSRYGQSVVFCSRKNFAQVREEFPGVPIYGIWQLVLASKTNWDKALYAVYFDNAKQTGTFIEHRDDEFRSGGIAAGKLLTTLSDAETRTVEPIGLELSELKFPSEPIMTRAERSRAMRSHYRKTAAALAVGIATGLSAFFGASQLLAQRQQDSQHERDILADEIAVLLERRELLQSSRLTAWPNQWALMRPLARLSQEAIRFEVWGAKFGHAIEIRLLPEFEHEQVIMPQWMQALPGIKSDRQFDGSLKLSWQSEAVR